MGEEGGKRQITKHAPVSLKFNINLRRIVLL